MDSARRVLERGIVYIDEGGIVAVQPASDPMPPNFEGSPIIRTGGTLYPGLIELHNHLSYDVLPLWDVPRPFSNRAQWGRLPDYRKLISGPMQVLGRTPGIVEAVVRYVECKCLFSGVTTSQGIALFSNQGIRRYYRGIVRNVEETNEVALPEAKTRISDVDASQADRFLLRLQGSSCLLLHLREGIDERAREHFQALQLPSGSWAITPALSGIHCAGLAEADFSTLQDNGGSMVWSPLSNYLLYGDTAAIETAVSRGVTIGIGSDWSPTGSKNLLGELKAARLVSDAKEGIVSNEEILAMATINAAKILKWDAVIGSLEAGKRADLLVVAGRRGNPYERLMQARESSIILVVINSVPRYGQSRLMRRFGGPAEDWRVGRAQRQLNLKQETADPVVGELTLRAARDRLADAMRRLPELAADLEAPEVTEPVAETEPRWFLELDHSELAGESFRPHLPFGPESESTGVLASPEAALPLSELLESIELDRLTVVDDRGFLPQIARQSNLPAFLKERLPDFY
jgi:cytosine/adenosine deaminase-related metal-dependent hydrolase